METIKSSTDISLLFDQGQRYQTSFLTLIVLETRDQVRYPDGRVAFIAGKKLGNAVWRNRAKRRMRALCTELDISRPGLDIVFLAKGSVIREPYKNEVTLLSKVIEKINA